MIFANSVYSVFCMYVMDISIFPLSIGNMLDIVRLASVLYFFYEGFVTGG